MPLPSPKKGEKESEFVQKCMGSDVMNKEFPKQAQRFAVCKSLFKQAKKKKSKAEWEETEKEINESSGIVW